MPMFSCRRAPGAAALCLATLLPFLAAPAQAQDAYPAKPIKFIIPFAGGSATDLIYRAITEQAGQQLHQTIVVEPKPGAGAVVATNYLFQQAPDGYTLMASTSSQTISSAKQNPPFDVRKMTHVLQAVGGPIFLSVSVKNLPNVTTLKQFIDYARTNPGKINFGSYGEGSLGHLAVELFNRTAHVETVHVPFNGSAADAQAVSSGTSDASMNVLAFIQPQVDAGKVRVLAASTQERSPIAPTVPGMRDAGLPGFNVIFWQGVAGPPGLPRDVVVKLNGAFNAALKSQPVVDYAAKIHNILFGGTPEAMTEIVNREVDQWAKLIKEANIKVD